MEVYLRPLKDADDQIVGYALVDENFWYVTNAGEFTPKRENAKVFRPGSPLTLVVNFCKPYNLKVLLSPN